MKTEVVNVIHRNFDIYIGRPSKWGNSFIIGKDGDRNIVIIKYEAWIKEQPELMAALSELKGKKLGCFCKPLPCHGDVLIKLLNQLDIDDIFD